MGFWAGFHGGYSMSPSYLTILRTITMHQPILIRDLYLALPSWNSRTVDNILRCLSDEGLIHGRSDSRKRYKGPVWLTVRGRGVIDEI